MYTLGTSALAWLKTQIADTDLLTALNHKMLAFVGTQADRLGDADQPATLISPYSIFFEVQGTGHVITEPITSAQAYRPAPLNVPVPTSWVQVGQPLNQSMVLQVLLPAGAIKNAHFVIPRGMLTDLPAVPKIDGLFYFARDTQELYIYDQFTQTWTTISGGGGGGSNDLFIGAMIIFPDILALSTLTQLKWLRCNGAELLITAYQALYDVIGKNFENTLTPTDADHFRLPLQSNTLIRFI
jgi:hypothetical protein